MELLTEIIKIMDDKQADDIVTLDFREKSPYVDYFVIASARNSRLALAILDAVEDYASKQGIKIISNDYNKDAKWFLLDIGSIVVHVFCDDEREKYDLEGLWKDLIKK